MITLPSLENLKCSHPQACAWLLGVAEMPFADRREQNRFEQALIETSGCDCATFFRIRETVELLQREFSDGINALICAAVQTPLGEMLAVFGAEGLCLLEFIGQKGANKELAAVQRALHGRFVFAENAQTQMLRNELNDYFSGKLKTFETPLQMVGTDFQKQVWRALLAIPYGETRSYKAQSEWVGNPKAVRAVAAANGQNKVSILIPCHRVIGSNGKLVGYAGGLNRKQVLLATESGNAQETLF